MMTFTCGCGRTETITPDDVADMRAHWPSVEEGAPHSAEIDPNWTDAQFLAWVDGLHARGCHGLLCSVCTG